MRDILKLIACAIVLASCRGKKQEESAGDVARAPATAPAAAVTEAAWSPDAIDELVAPIALYPDQLVGQILAASVNSQEVLDAGNWLLQNETLKGDQLDAAAVKAGFGPAVRALVQFPTVVDMMCQEIDWTRQVGAAFTSDQKAVLDAVQRLRAQAADVGNLTTTPQQTVERKTEEGKEIVEVKPADPKVVYVPQYDPSMVYTTPAPAAPAPAPAPTSDPNTVSKSSAVAGGLLAFGVGILVGSAINNDDCYPHWGSGAVYYGPRPFYPPAYVYRPAYGPAFRPAYGYASPAGYRNRYNSPTNVVINNNNYYNKFNNQQNLRVNNSRGAGAATRQAGAGNRVGQSANAGRSKDWKGQSGYAGARPSATDRGPGTNATARNAPGVDRKTGTPQRTTATSERKGATPQRGTQPAAAQRSNGRTQAQARPAAQPNDRAAGTRDRGYGTAAPAGGRDAATANRAQSSAQPAPNAARNASSNASSPARDNALSGASKQGTGSFDRAASARGHASAPAPQKQSARGGRKP
jgi:hypothetical protein